MAGCYPVRNGLSPGEPATSSTATLLLTSSPLVKEPTGDHYSTTDAMVWIQRAIEKGWKKQAGRSAQSRTPGSTWAVFFYFSRYATDNLYAQWLASLYVCRPMCDQGRRIQSQGTEDCMQQLDRALWPIRYTAWSDAFTCWTAILNYSNIQ